MPLFLHIAYFQVTEAQKSAYLWRGQAVAMIRHRLPRRQPAYAQSSHHPYPDPAAGHGQRLSGAKCQCLHTGRHRPARLRAQNRTYSAPQRSWLARHPPDCHHPRPRRPRRQRRPATRIERRPHRCPCRRSAALPPRGADDVLPQRLVWPGIPTHRADARTLPAIHPGYPARRHNPARPARFRHRRHAAPHARPHPGIVIADAGQPARAGRRPARLRHPARRHHPHPSRQKPTVRRRPTASSAAATGAAAHRSRRW